MEPTKPIESLKPNVQSKSPQQNPSRRAIKSERPSDLRAQIRNSSLPESQILGLGKPESQREAPRLQTSSLANRFTGSKIALAQQNLLERSRVNTSPETLRGPRKNTGEQNPKSPAFNAGQRSILELQQSIIDPQFRRMSSRVPSQAKIKTYRQVAVRRVHPEMLIYKVKKIALGKKSDPEVGKIKLRVDRFGSQDLNKFPGRPEFPLRKTPLEDPGSASSNRTHSKNRPVNDLSSLASKSARPDPKSQNSPSRQDDALLQQNFPNQDKPQPAPGKIDSPPNENFISRIRLHEGIQETTENSRPFDPKPVPVLKLKPLVTLPLPALSNRRTSFSQARKILQSTTPTSADKNEVRAFSRPNFGRQSERHLDFLISKAQDFQTDAENPTAPPKRRFLSFLTGDPLRIAEKTMGEAAKIPRRPVDQEKSLSIEEESQSQIQSTLKTSQAQPNPKNSNLKPSTEGQAPLTNSELPENQPEAKKIPEVSILKTDKLSHLLTEIAEVDQLLKSRQDQKTDEKNSENLGDPDFDGEEQDIVPKIDSPPALNARGQFSTIQETDEEDRSVSSKFGTELLFGTRPTQIPDKALPQAKNPLQRRKTEREPHKMKSSGKDSSSGGLEFSVRTVGDSIRKYETEQGDTPSEGSENRKARNTVDTPNRIELTAPQRLSEPAESKRELLNFQKPTANSRLLEIEFSSENFKGGQSYLENFGQSEALIEKLPNPILGDEKIQLAGPKIESEEIKKEGHSENVDPIPLIKGGSRLEEPNPNAGEDIAGYLEEIRKSAPSPKEEASPLAHEKSKIGQSSEVSWQFGQESQNDLADKNKLETADLENLPPESETENLGTNRNFTFQQPKADCQQIDLASLVAFKDSHFEQIVSVDDPDHPTNFLLSRVDPKETTVPKNTEIVPKLETPRITEPETPRITEPETPTINFAKDNVLGFPKETDKLSEDLAKGQFAVEDKRPVKALPALGPLALITINLGPEQVIVTLQLPVIPPSSIVYFTSGQENIRPININYAIAPAEVVFVTFETEILGELPKESDSDPLIDSPESVKPVAGHISSEPSNLVQQVLVTLQLPVILPSSIVYFTSGQENLRPININQVIAPAEVVFVTFETERLGELPKESDSDPLKDFPESVKPVARHISSEPSNLVHLQIQKEALRAIVKNPPMLPLHLISLSKDSQVIRKTALGLSHNPISSTFVSLPREELKSQGEQFKDGESKFPSLGNANLSNKEENKDRGSKSEKGSGQELIASPSNKISQQVNEKIPDQPRDSPILEKAENPPQDLKEAPKTPVKSSLAKLEPEKDTGTIRETKEQKNPLESQKGAKGGVLQERQDSKGNALGAKKFEGQATPTKSKLSGSSTKAKAEGPKENSESANANPSENRSASKRAGKSSNDGNISASGKKNARKGERVRLDDSDPALSEKNPQIEQKPAPRTSKVKFQQAQEAQKDTSGVFDSVSENFLKRNIYHEQEDLTSLDTISLLDLDPERLEDLPGDQGDPIGIYKKNQKSKRQMREVKSLAGVCCFFFFASSILWIILFKILSDKNAFLSTIILQPPTLSHYHQAYSAFFHNYDQNLDLHRDSQRVLDQDLFPKYHERAAALRDFAALKLDNSLSLLAVKKFLADQVDALPSQKRLNAQPPPRDLRGRSDFQRKESRAKLAAGELARVGRRLELMRAKFLAFEHSRAEMQRYLQDVEDRAEGLYRRCFELIDDYSRFYLMTNRLWITTENIYQHFRKRAVEVIDEMKMAHYRNYYSKKMQVKLLYLHHKGWAKITDFPWVEIFSERRSLLMCTIKAEVAEEGNVVGRSFDFLLALNGKYGEFRKSFEYKVVSEIKVVLISQVLDLPSGINKIDLFAIISADQVTFSKLYFKCVNLIEFKKIAE